MGRSSVVLEANRKTQEITNDYLRIFASGAPHCILEKISTRFGNQDLASTGSKETKEAKAAKLTNPLNQEALSYH
jgi:hypothetical protein